MTAGGWIRIVVLLGAACFVSLTAMIAASDTTPDQRTNALQVAQVFTLALVTAAVVSAVLIAEPFTGTRRRAALVLALAPTTAAALMALLALAGVEPTLSAAWVGLFAVWAVMAWATARHGAASAIVAAGVGWWLVCGGSIAWASTDAIVDPDHSARGSFSESGNDLVVVMSLFAYVLLIGATAAVQAVALALAAARRRVQSSG